MIISNLTNCISDIKLITEHLEDFFIQKIAYFLNIKTQKLILNGHK